MATPLSGRYAQIRLSSDSTAEATIVPMLGHWEVVISVDEADASVFGTVWKKNMPTLQSWRGSIEGFADPSTAYAEQIAGLLNPAMDATKVQDIRFYLGTTSTSGAAGGLFFMPNYSTLSISASGSIQSTLDGAYITNVRYTQDKSGLGTFACDVIGYGGIALYQGTSEAPLVESPI